MSLHLEEVLSRRHLTQDVLVTILESSDDILVRWRSRSVVAEEIAAYHRCHSVGAAAMHYNVLMETQLAALVFIALSVSCALGETPRDVQHLCMLMHHGCHVD